MCLLCLNPVCQCYLFGLVKGDILVECGTESTVEMEQWPAK